jgi:thioredoxin reductase
MVMGDLVTEVDVAVLGGGPGGYSAAFRCAELGLETVVVDAGKRLGGACLYEGLHSLQGAPPRRGRARRGRARQGVRRRLR